MEKSLLLCHQTASGLRGVGFTGGHCKILLGRGGGGGGGGIFESGKWKRVEVVKVWLPFWVSVFFSFVVFWCVWCVEHLLAFVFVFLNLFSAFCLCFKVCLVQLKPFACCPAFVLTTILLPVGFSFFQWC